MRVFVARVRAAGPSNLCPTFSPKPFSYFLLRIHISYGKLTFGVLHLYSERLRFSHRRLPFRCRVERSEAPAAPNIGV